MTKRIGDQPLTGAEKFARWWKRHEEERLLARMARGPSVKRYGVVRTVHCGRVGAMRLCRPPG